MRDRIVQAFDEELHQTPVPPGLRAIAVRGALSAPRRTSRRPAVLAFVATLVVVALIATFVIGSHLLRTTPIPAGSTTAPPGRGAAAVAYDEAHGVMVLFGGTGFGAGSYALGETWTWDGRYWVQHHPSASPSPRYYVAMAYDQARRDVVMFGGMAGSASSYHDTWTWNGSSWQARHPAHDPVFGYAWQAPVMAFDPVSRNVLLSGFTPDYKPQTWSWNGSDWTQLAPVPAASNTISMFDDGSQLLTVTVAADGTSGRSAWETEAWNGSAWIRVDTPFTPALDPIASSAFDAATKQLVVLGGDTWTWDGAHWTRQHPTVVPASMGYMVYMPNLREVVSWGDVTSAPNNAMYAWTGSDWKVISPNTVPSGPGSGKGESESVLSPSDAAALVRRTVTNTSPVLVPTYIPSFVYDATVGVTPDMFHILYQSDLRDKSIEFGIEVPNPPTSPIGKDSMVKFRNSLPLKYSAQGYADYYVSDPADPESARYLIWIEPGTMKNPQLAAGVPYFLSATGLTDAEFWQVANSLR